MDVVVIVGFLAAVAAATGAAAGRIARSLPIGIVAGVLALAAELYWAVRLLADATGEYGDRSRYVDAMLEFGWFGALVLHAAAPAALLLLIRWAGRTARQGLSADDAADEREHDGERA